MAHPGVKKTYADLKPLFYWSGMKKDVVSFVERCLECQLVKAEHRNPRGIATTTCNPGIKMGGYINGFYCWVTNDWKKT